MKVLILGGTGFVGQRLQQVLTESGHLPALVSRRPAEARSRFPGVEVLEASPTDPDALASVVEGFDGVVNLAGEPIAARWTGPHKEAIRRSRVETTRAVVAAIRSVEARPRVLVNGSAIGFYGPSDGAPLDESEPAPTQPDFLSEVCQAWEEAASAGDDSTRVVRLRIGLVLGKGGGALQKMLPPFRMFVGGPIGRGDQWMSWIHIDDLCGLIVHALTREEVSGPVNGTAPEAVTNLEFSQALGRALDRPCWLPAPPFALRLVLGEMADLLTTGQNVVPRRALDAGYEFQFPQLDRALRDVLYEGPPPGQE